MQTPAPFPPSHPHHHPHPPSTHHDASAAAKAGDFIMHTVFAMWRGFALCAAAELGISDVLVAGPKTTAELAEQMRLNEDHLHRLLRCLQAQGVYAQHRDGKWALTASSQLLVSGEASMRHFVMMLAQPPHYLAWGRLVDSVRDGHTGAHHAFHGRDVWAVFKDNSHWQHSFDCAMSNISASTGLAVAEAVKADIAQAAAVMDVGGSRGVMLSQMLRAAGCCAGGSGEGEGAGAQGGRTIKAICFDQPHVAEAARLAPPAELASSGIAKAIEYCGGNFFESVPDMPANSVITMKFIVHDWADKEAMQILRVCHKALRCGGRLFVCDMVNDGNAAATLMDLNMMAVSGGRERSEHEFRALLEGAGFVFERIVPTQSLVSVIMASRPADA